jgi:hypothetical protein
LVGLGITALAAVYTVKAVTWLYEHVPFKSA